MFKYESDLTFIKGKLHNPNARLYDSYTVYAKVLV